AELSFLPSPFRRPRLSSPPLPYRYARSLACTSRARDERETASPGTHEKRIEVAATGAAAAGGLSVVNMAQEDVGHLSDAGLALGLSLGGGGGGTTDAAAAHRGGCRRPSPSSQCPPLEPSLTLSLPDDAAAGAAA
ncbi:Os03g0231000, partial [Oryza sativa Japonica Group]